jgi:sugar phosphate isomerase/epimerase
VVDPVAERDMALWSARESQNPAAIRVLNPGSPSEHEVVMPSAISPAIQLYTVRRLLEQDFDGTLAKLAEIGFREVEPFDLPTLGERLATGLPHAGLRAPSTHAGILEDSDTVLAMAAELGIPLVIQPWTEPDRWTSVADIRAIADELNAAARQASASGIQVGYHNHHFELASRIDGRHALELLTDHLAPDVVLQIDAYWAHVGGADVPALIRRLGDRVVALHLKDGDGSLDPSRQVAAGQGVVPIQAVVDAAPAALPIVEFDDTSGDLLTAIRESRAFLMELARG